VLLLGGRAVGSSELEFAFSLAAGESRSLHYTMHVASPQNFLADRDVDNLATAEGVDITPAQDQATIAVRSLGGPPTATDDHYTCPMDGSMARGAPGVLGNDTTSQSTGLEAQAVWGPSHAMRFALNADGSFVYVPEPGYTGTDAFAYNAVDRAGSDQGVARIDVVAPPPAPPLPKESTATPTPAPAVGATESVSRAPTTPVSATSTGTSGASQSFDPFSRAAAMVAARLAAIRAGAAALLTKWNIATPEGAAPCCAVLLILTLASVGAVAIRRRTSDDALDE
jgi:hypothetical protein